MDFTQDTSGFVLHNNQVASLVRQQQRKTERKLQLSPGSVVEPAWKPKIELYQCIANANVMAHTTNKFDTLGELRSHYTRGHSFL